MSKDLAVETYDHIKKGLAPDGALRDIRVLETTVADWRRFIDFVEIPEIRANYTRDGDALAVPVSLEDFIGGSRDQSGVLMTFRLEDMDFHCRYHAVNEIELDIDPKQIKGTAALDSLLEFMISLGRRLGKDVLLADEGFWLNTSPRWEDVICSYSSAIDDLMIGAEPRSLPTRPLDEDEIAALGHEPWKRTFWKSLEWSVKGWGTGFEVSDEGLWRRIGSAHICLMSVGEQIFAVVGYPIVDRPNEFSVGGSTVFEPHVTKPIEAAERMAGELRKSIHNA